MRHRHGLRKLNRTSSHRLAMLRNMTVSCCVMKPSKPRCQKQKNCAA
jgi:large subunit ribosomal protein L17